MAVSEGNGEHKSMHQAISRLTDSSGRQWDEINRIGARVLVIETNFKHTEKAIEELKGAVDAGFMHVNEKLQKLDTDRNEAADRRLASSDRRVYVAVSIISGLLMLILGWLGKGALGL